MIEIEFSVMENNAGDAKQLLPLLDTFEKEHHVHVNLSGITWPHGWAEIANFGIYQHGPDVSSIGTTWIGSLAAMQALRPFTSREVRVLGGAEAFFGPVWRTGFLPNSSALWAVPWLGDVMLLYYWEDALRKAGIRNFETSFATDVALAETLEKLQKSGINYPLAINVKSDSIILHEAAHWVWDAGGNFISADGKRVAFNQPAALQGLRNYFQLRPFISPELLGGVSTASLFNTGKAVVHFAGPWLGTAAENLNWDKNAPEVIALPGTAFVGGSSLVIWQYTVHPQEAFELVNFLATQPIQAPTSLYRHQVPTRREALNVPLAENDVFHRAYFQYLQSIQRGQSFPTMRLWGAVEDKLRVGISSIWADLFVDPDQDLDVCIHKYLDPLAERLNITLGN
jgi:multiple sugar transport system substrate-binding protein